MFFKKKKEARRIIEFSCSPYNEGYPHPLPAHQAVPTWWKNLDRHMEGEPNTQHNNGLVEGAGIPHGETVKACVPVLDTLRTGYIIPLWTELIIGFTDSNPNYPIISWNYQGLGQRGLESKELKHVYRSNVDPKTFAAAEGMPIYNRALENNFPYMFTINCPWTIKTPPGYSCLFTKPLNSDLPFDFINGIVNTDKYPIPVNWNFMMNRRFKGTLRVGTPMMQVIPFKRDEWESDVHIWTDKDNREANIAITQLDMYFEGGYQRSSGCPINHT